MKRGRQKLHSPRSRILFSRRRIKNHGTASPKAFYHDHGTWNVERKVLIVDLKQKIILFLDQPHYMLVEALRPLLSHDRRQLVYKITDKNEAERSERKPWN